MAMRHVVAVVGGATAGAETASMLASRGALVVVFEQNRRPYGKIEDGLPRWHAKLRQMEYESVNDKLDHPNIHYVPLTKIGRDIDFSELVGAWGFTAVILALGAWRDRPLPIDGIDAYVGRGLIYQNPFIYWFNHFHEPGYDGPSYSIADQSVVVGGGLASIDVLKVLQVENTRRALERRGIHADMLHIEHEGIDAALAEHGLDRDALGLKGSTLFYRRRIEDMPLTEMPAAADAVRRLQVESTRRRIVEKAMKKYAFHVRVERIPAGAVTDGDRLVGMRFQHAHVTGGRVVPVEGAFETVHTPVVVSSIGSVPEPIPGVQVQGETFAFSDESAGRLAGHEAVFAVGNAVTGKGNILASRRHSTAVTSQVIEQFLGLSEKGHDGEEVLLDAITQPVNESIAGMLDFVRGRHLLDEAQVERILARVRSRQREIGYDASFRDWVTRHAPPPA